MHGGFVAMKERTLTYHISNIDSPKIALEFIHDIMAYSQNNENTYATEQLHN